MSLRMAGHAKHPSAEGVMPCVTRTHTFWNVAAQRPFAGEEMLGVQGLPRDMQVENLTDAQLQAFAGNTMCPSSAR